MGREVRTFRQTRRTGLADNGARNFARVNRSGIWGKIINVFKKGGNTTKWHE